jgi:hypothetical protein
MNIRVFFEAALGFIIVSLPLIIGCFIFCLLIVGGILLQNFYKKKEQELIEKLYKKWSKKN